MSELNLVRHATTLLDGPGGWLWQWLDTPWANITFATAVVLWLLQGFWHKRATLIRMLGTGLLAVMLTDPLVSQVLKPNIGRLRPCNAADLDVPRCSSSYSFPSNHAANTAAIAIALQSPPLAAVSLLAGSSRVVLGLHYPSDILAGWLVGGALGAAARYLVARATRALSQRSNPHAD